MPNKELRMTRRKKDDIPRLLIPKNATLRQIYAKYRQEFTAADLQQYTEIEDGIPLEKIIADMESIEHEDSKRSSKNV
jgi:hypothetical protein